MEDIINIIFITLFSVLAIVCCIAGMAGEMHQFAGMIVNIVMVVVNIKELKNQHKK